MDKIAANNLTLGFQMGETFKVMGKSIAMELPTHGLEVTSMEQYILLHAIDGMEDATQQELSKVFNKDKSGILRLTDELERKKMVVRIVDSSDRRKKTLMLTKRGMETLRKMQAIEASVSERMLRGVSEAELKVFSKVLSVIQKNARS